MEFKSPILEKIRYADELGITNENFLRFKQTVDRNLNHPADFPPPLLTVTQWKRHEFKCAVCRMDLIPEKNSEIYHCGYVHVPEDHPLERCYFDEFNPGTKYPLTFRCKSIEHGSWFGFMGYLPNTRAISFLGKLSILEVHEETEKLADYMEANKCLNELRLQESTIRPI